MDIPYTPEQLLGPLNELERRNAPERLFVRGHQAFDSLGGRVSFFTWPADQRPAGSGAALHAKAVIADAQVAFITSANLTGAALDHNLELGVLVRGGSVPRRLHEHFLALMASGVLRLAG
jgi:phosphatidylserine/phosphatidylglycerophosphate/cardiolipin synthase-like enzyme